LAEAGIPEFAAAFEAGSTGDVFVGDPDFEWLAGALNCGVGNGEVLGARMFSGRVDDEEAITNYVDFVIVESSFRDASRFGFRRLQTSRKSYGEKSMTNGQRSVRIAKSYPDELLGSVILGAVSTPVSDGLVDGKNQWLTIESMDRWSVVKNLDVGTRQTLATPWFRWWIKLADEAWGPLARTNVELINATYRETSSDQT
jgi:hypothetical protein